MFCSLNVHSGLGTGFSSFGSFGSTQIPFSLGSTSSSATGSFLTSPKEGTEPPKTLAEKDKEKEKAKEKEKEEKKEAEDRMEPKEPDRDKDKKVSFTFPSTGPLFPTSSTAFGMTP